MSENSSGGPRTGRGRLRLVPSSHEEEAPTSSTAPPTSSTSEQALASAVRAGRSSGDRPAPSAATLRADAKMLRDLARKAIQDGRETQAFAMLVVSTDLEDAARAR